MIASRGYRATDQLAPARDIREPAARLPYLEKGTDPCHPLRLALPIREKLPGSPTASRRFTFCRSMFLLRTSMRVVRLLVPLPSALGALRISAASTGSGEAEAAEDGNKLETSAS